MTRRVRVPLGARAYEVRIGHGLLARAGEEMAPLLARPRVAVVTDAAVAGRHLDRLTEGLARAGIGTEAHVLAGGEATKSWPHFQETVEWLLARGVEREDTVLALGGGVVGDLAGFACAVLRRGVGLIQLPTTLLAQVDSAVGGKTGINSAQGKNLIGAFHQPRLVLADTATLDTLPAREILAGYGEVVKYGLLADADFFAWLEAHGPALAAGDADACAHAVARSCAIKAGIVAGDERETGERARLNLGHTFAHALEAATGYSDRLRHGEAVAIGCRLAFDLSARLGLCAPAEAERAGAHLAVMGMRRALADIPGELPDAGGLMALMAQDKKVRDGRPRFVLAQGIGAASAGHEVPPDVLRDFLAAALSGADCGP